MSFYFRKSLLLQLLYVGFLGLACFLMDYFLAPTPPLRGKIILLTQGMVAGFFICAVLFIFELLSTFLSKSSLSRLEDYERRNTPNDMYARLGALAFVPVAEEVFFRGYVLNFLVPLGGPLALGLHALINIPFFYAGRSTLLPLAFKLIQLSLLGYAFLETKSLALCVVASVLCSLLHGFLFLPGLKRVRKLLS